MRPPSLWVFFFIIFFPPFCLFIVASLNTATLIMRSCRGITHVKEANLINFLFYVLCVCASAARLAVVQRWLICKTHQRVIGKICFTFI